jgi:hypothetical protein
MELAPSPTPARPLPFTLAPLTPTGPQPNLEKQAATLSGILNKQEKTPENRGGGVGLACRQGRSLAFGGAKLGLEALRP